MTTQVSKPDVVQCERVFRRNGLPLLIEGHSAGRDVFGRAAPFLLVVLVGQLSGAAKLDWSAWVNTAAILGAILVITGGYMLLNRLRGRPWTTLPQQVDTPELAFFVLAPALLPLVFGGQFLAAAITAGANAILLVAVWFTVRYGLGSTLWWGLARIIDELALSVARLLRMLPLLLVFSLVLFFNEAVWQVFDTIPTVSSLLLGAIFVMLIVTSLSLRLPGEVDGVLEHAAQRVSGADALAPLTRPQRLNVNTMMLASQILQVLVVSLGVGIFFVIVGVLTVSPELQETWAISGGSWSYDLVIDGSTLRISHTLIRVSVALATFTGLFYGISMLTDAIYRTEFIEAITQQMTTVTETRVRYQVLVAPRAHVLDASAPMNG